VNAVVLDSQAVVGTPPGIEILGSVTEVPSGLSTRQHRHGLVVGAHSRAPGAVDYLGAIVQGRNHRVGVRLCAPTENRGGSRDGRRIPGLNPRANPNEASSRLSTVPLVVQSVSTDIRSLSPRIDSWAGVPTACPRYFEEPHHSRERGGAVVGRTDRDISTPLHLDNLHDHGGRKAAPR
jgi:hypothetical protein